MTTLAETLDRSLEHHRAGDLEQAKVGYRELLRFDPRHTDALHLLGLVAYQEHKHQAAVDHIRRAIAVNQNIAAYHCNLGAAYKSLDKPDEAARSYREAIRLEPEYTDAYFNLGIVLRTLGKIDDAADSYRRALQITPDNAQLHNNLGIVINGQGDRAEAMHCFRRALEIQPDYVEASINLGNTLLAVNQPAAAVQHFEHILQLDPDRADIRNQLGRALHGAGRLEESIRCLQQAIENQPDNADTHLNMGNAFVSCRQLDQARRCFRRVVELEADNNAGWINLCNVLKAQRKTDEARTAYQNVLRLMPDQPLAELWLATLCPIVFQTNAQIDESRSQLLEELERLAALRLQLDISQFDAGASTPPSDLQFHGHDNRPILETFAKIFRHCFSEERPAAGSGKPHVGFVVTSGHEGVFVRSQGGLLERMNRDLFDLTVVCSPTGAAAIRSELKCDSIRYLTIPNPFDKVVETVRAARFDLLYHWETGSDVTNYFLPFCRLAPVQCVGGGNATTSGIPAIDYFLSSDLQEPEDAAGHYTETLLRLHTLESYQPRVHLPAHAKTRDDFGLPHHQNLYVCAQKIQKIHPDFDHVLADILRRDRRGVVVLVEDQSGVATAGLKRRFESSIPDVAGRINFQPRLGFFDYLSLLSVADVLLDPIYYGGGMTLYDGTSLNKPMVTWPSQFVRGRHAYGFYRKMGVSSCVASSLSEYAAIAVAIGSDPLYRSAVAAEIREASHVIFEDLNIVREHERVFEMLIEQSRSSRMKVEG